jgi:hypothetical protein
MKGDDRTSRSVSNTGEGTDSTAHLLKPLHQHEESHSAKHVRADLVKAGTKGSLMMLRRLEGVLLRRPDQNFFETADEISQELQELSVTLQPRGSP